MSALRWLPSDPRFPLSGKNKGIVVIRSRGRGWPLGYGAFRPRTGHGFGFGSGWLDYRLQRLIVRLWNHLNCRIFGHDDGMVAVLDAMPSLKEARCPSCSTVLKRTEA